jgi:four helix bundle protein
MMSEMRGKDLAQRTKGFALRIIRMYSALPKTATAQVHGNQILRSGPSVGAQYHEAMRARSTAEFISKAQMALQELEETNYWLELLVDGEVVAAHRLAALPKEANELTAILVSSVKTAKRRRDSRG